MGGDVTCTGKAADHDGLGLVSDLIALAARGGAVDGAKVAIGSEGVTVAAAVGGGDSLN